MTRFATAALMWGAVILGACSPENLAASRDGNADTSTSAPLDALAVERCTGSLSDLRGRCQASFDGTFADLPACTGIGQMVKACGDVIAIVQGSGFTTLTCYYDAATHVLVGAFEASDTTGFCNGESFARADGQIPGPSCDTTAPFFLRTCPRPDASAD